MCLRCEPISQSVTHSVNTPFFTCRTEACKWPLDPSEDASVNIFEQKLDHVHLRALWGNVKAMICCRGVIKLATHLEHVYLLFYHRSKLEHQQPRCENNKVDPGFYVGVPFPSSFPSSVYFLTISSVFLLAVSLSCQGPPFQTSPAFSHFSFLSVVQCTTYVLSMNEWMLVQRIDRADFSALVWNHI